MTLRLLLAFAVLLASACTNNPSKKPAIDEIDRRHTEDMQRMGGLPPLATNSPTALAGT